MSDKRIAIVTGAGQGIGRETSVVLAREGFTVVCVDMNGAAAQETATLVNGIAAPAMDVRDEAAVAALASIPSREVLLSQLLGVMLAPVSGFARGLAALAAKKSEGAPAAAEAAAEEAPAA